MIWFFFLLLTLNGFPLETANYGIYTYLGWSTLTTLITSAIASLIIKYLQKTSLNRVLAVTLAVICSMILTAVSDFGGLIISSLAVEQMR